MANIDDTDPPERPVVRLCEQILTLTTERTPLYTAPANTTTIVRLIHACNAHSSAVTFTLTVNDKQLGRGLFHDTLLAGATSVTWSGTLELTDGDVLQGQAEIDNTIMVVASGIETAAEPPSEPPDLN